MNQGTGVSALYFSHESHVQQMKYLEHLIHTKQFMSNYVATVADVAGGLEKDFGL